MSKLPRFVMFAIVGSLACNESAPVSPRVNALDLVFLTQSERPAITMEALFTGRVIVDAASCTRLDNEGRATVIWPTGYTVRQDGDAVQVVNDQGQELGRLGESFRIGGGEAPTLYPALHISYVDRAMVNESCPGRYWIASDVSSVR